MISRVASTPTSASSKVVSISSSRCGIDGLAAEHQRGHALGQAVAGARQAGFQPGEQAGLPWFVLVLGGLVFSEPKHGMRCQ